MDQHKEVKIGENKNVKFDCLKHLRFHNKIGGIK